MTLGDPESILRRVLVACSRTDFLAASFGRKLSPSGSSTSRATEAPEGQESTFTSRRADARRSRTEIPQVRLRQFHSPSRRPWRLGLGSGERRNGLRAAVNVCLGVAAVPLRGLAKCSAVPGALATIAAVDRVRRHGGWAVRTPSGPRAQRKVSVATSAADLQRLLDELMGHDDPPAEWMEQLPPSDQDILSRPEVVPEEAANNELALGSGFEVWLETTSPSSTWTGASTWRPRLRRPCSCTAAPTCRCRIPTQPRCLRPSATTTWSRCPAPVTRCATSGGPCWAGWPQATEYLSPLPAPVTGGSRPT